MKKIVYILLLCLTVVSCIEDGFTSSPSDQPVFSTDTLDMGVVFTEEVTTTRRFVVHNPYSKQLSISSIRLSGDYAECFRLNVDGIGGIAFQNVDIRGKDSVFVFVEATFPAGIKPQTTYEAQVDFTTNGVTNSVVLTATGQNVRRLEGLVLEEDTNFDAELPYQIFDSLVVSPGVKMTVKPGTQLLFHDKAALVVRGTLDCRGTVDEPVVLAGDRTGNVVADISFDLMSRQWEGIFFVRTSKNNTLVNTVVKNTWYGVAIQGDGSGTYDEPQLTMLNCRLRNSGGRVFEAYHSYVRAVGCEFAEAASGLVYLEGGRHVFNHCTFANQYLFAAVSGPAIQLNHLCDDIWTDAGTDLPYMQAEITNSILWGYGGDVAPGDLTGTGVFFRSCMLKSKGEDDENFIACLWDADPEFYTVRSDYLFDYRLKPESPAIGMADPALTLPEAATDGYGLPRTEPADLGAYVFTEPEEEE